MSLFKKSVLASVGIAAAAMLATTQAQATEGYFQNGLGARGKSMAGAGVANAKDATAITLNPAGLVNAGRQFNGAVSLFMPTRSYTTGAPAVFAIPGSQKSKSNFFAVPDIAYSHPLTDTMTLGFAISGNGGMNTTYSAPGPFGGGKTGVDLMQVNITAGIGAKLGKYVSVGVAPILTIQRFKATGLAPFAPLSSAPGSLTNRGYAYSTGAGVRVGVEVRPTERLRVGASYQSRTYMSRFKKYAGLFAERGDFDVPANFQIGVAYDVTPDLTLMVDARRIMYSQVRSIANGFNPFAPLGAGAGTGFGWKDVTAIKFGAEYAATDALTVRAGYSYNSSPLRGSQLLLNILAPATSQHHITAGASYKFSEHSQFDFAAMFSPNTTKVGAGPLGLQPVRVKMHQLEITAGYTHHF